MALIKNKKPINPNPISPIREEAPVKTTDFTIDSSAITNKAKQLVKAKIQELMHETHSEIQAQKDAATAEAEELIKKAEEQAQIILSEAEAEARKHALELEEKKTELENQELELNRITALEKEKSFNAGMEEAKHYINELILWIGEFNKCKSKILHETEKEIAALALDVAKQILGHEAAIDSTTLEKQVHRSIARVINSKGIIQIYLNPQDNHAADYLEISLRKVIDNNIKLVFLTDENIDQGSCIINTQGGRLDASFRTQLNLVKVSFEKYLGYKIDELPEMEILEEPDDEALDKIESELDSINIADPKGVETVAGDKKKKPIDLDGGEEQSLDLLLNDEEEVEEAEFEEFDETEGFEDIGDDSNFDDDLNRDHRYPEY